MFYIFFCKKFAEIKRLRRGPVNDIIKNVTIHRHKNYKGRPPRRRRHGRSPYEGLRKPWFLDYLSFNK
jgi:hypothetical protein